MLRATCHAVDDALAVEFDATPWFQEADPASIGHVAGQGWSSAWIADGLEKRPGYERLHELIDYARNRLGAESLEDLTFATFECTMSGPEAMARLDENRPDVAGALRTDRETWPLEVKPVPLCMVIAAALTAPQGVGAQFSLLLASTASGARHHGLSYPPRYRLAETNRSVLHIEQGTRSRRYRWLRSRPRSSSASWTCLRRAIPTSRWMQSSQYASPRCLARNDAIRSDAMVIGRLHGSAPTLKSLTMQIYEVVLKGWSATRKIHARRATKTGKTYIE